MSQNNGNDTSAIGFGLVLVGAFMIAMMAFLYAIAVFAAFVLTLFCLCAWNGGLTLGSWRLEQEEARAFVGRGLIGAFVVPVFLMFCEVLFGIRIQPEYWLHIVLGGYAAGSLGVEMMEAQAAEEQRQAAELLPPAPPPAQIAPPKGFIPEQPAPFRFARWDDEEETKR